MAGGRASSLLWAVLGSAMLLGAASCGQDFTSGSGGGGGAAGSGAATGTGGSGTGGAGGVSTTTTTTSAGGGSSGLALGEACIEGGECASALCVDEVCCDEACKGKCQACRAAIHGGSEPDGTCAATTWGADPEDDCTDYCNGDSVMKGACDGAGQCQWESSESCFPYTCNITGKVCFEQCSGEAHCAEGAACHQQTNTCLAVTSNGSP